MKPQALAAAVIAASLAGALSLWAANSDSPTLRVRIVDGDSIVLGAERVRLAGLNCPELRQPGGLTAKIALDRLIGSQPVRLERIGTDRYGRTVARAFVGRIDLACEMIRGGYCRPYYRFGGAAYDHCRP